MGFRFCPFVIQGRLRKEATLIRGLMSDGDWAFFEPFVITKRAYSGHLPRVHRLVLEGVFWIARTVVQWRDPPEFFGKWSAVYRQFRRWTLSSVWDDLLEALKDTDQVGETVQMIDGTVIRAHLFAAGAKRGTPKQSLGRSRGGFTTKIHLRTNGSGRPVAVEIAPGHASDYAGALPLLDADGPEPKLLIADRGYDADWLRETMEARSITSIIPTRKGR